MSNPQPEPNVLLGVVALENHWISSDALGAALSVWTRRPEKTLAAILREQGALSAEREAQTQQRVEEILLRQRQGSAVPVSVDAATLNVLASPAALITEAAGNCVLSAQATLDLPTTVSPLSTSAATAGGPVRYRALRPHARGGLGEVFLAFDEELHREVALKEIQTQHSANLGSRARFLLEAEVTGQLEHPGIVPVYGLGVYPDGRPYYAMRFIRGESFKDAIERFHQTEDTSQDSGQLRQLLRRFVDVCNAVAYAHSKGVLHRDLKPANVMLGQFGETLVVDWGLAKQLTIEESRLPSASNQQSSIDNSQSTDTQAGSVLGTPAFMSPEQALGALDQLTPTSDVFSLGAILATLLTGQSPIQGKDAWDTLEKARGGVWLSPRQLKPGTPAPLDAICRKAMARNPKDRYASALDLAADVEHWLADEPVAAHAEPLWTRLRRWCRKHRTLATGVLVAVFVAVIGLTASTILLTAANRRETEAKKQAEENYRLARQAVDQFSRKITTDRRLRNLPELRKMLVETSVPYYEQFIQQSAGDPKLRDELAEACERLGLIYDETGTRDKALKWFRQARDGYAQLAAGDARYEYPLARIYYNLASTYRDTYQLDDALAAYTETLKRYQALAKANPENAQFASELALAYSGQANLYRIMGKSAEALATYRQAFETLKGGAGKKDAAMSARNFAELHHDRARVHQGMQNFAEASRDLLQARQILTEALREVPRDTHSELRKHLRHDLALAELNLGNLHARQQQFEAALRQFDLARAGAMELREESLGFAAEDRIVAFADVNTGVIFNQRFQIDRSSQPLARGLRLLKRMHEQSPGDAEALHSLVKVLTNSGQLHLIKAQASGLPEVEQGKELAEALSFYQQADARWQELALDHKDAADIVTLLSIRSGSAMTLFKQGKLNEAVDSYDLAVSSAAKAGKKVDTGELTEKLLSVHAGRALALFRLGKLDLALQDVNRALELGGDPVAFAPFRAGILARSSSHREGVEIVEKLLSEWGKNAKPDQIYDAACVYSLALEGLKKDTKLSEKEKVDWSLKYAKRSVDLLRRAVEAGLQDVNKIKEAGRAGDRDLDPLREREEFKKLLDDLPRSKPPGK
jgi:serine/threonine-protein kinase